jgi:hypothetical protein
MHPAPPATVRVRHALTGLAGAELARQLEVAGRCLGKQRQRVEPGDAVGKEALGAADLALALLERRFESRLSGRPLAVEHQHRGPHAGGHATVEAGQRRGQQAGVSTLHGEVGERHAQALG